MNLLAWLSRQQSLTQRFRHIIANQKNNAKELIQPVTEGVKIETELKITNQMDQFKMAKIRGKRNRNSKRTKTNPNVQRSTIQ